MASLYELTENYNELLEMLYDEEIDEQIIFDTAESIEAEIEVKADNYAKVLKNLEMCYNACDEETQRLKKKSEMLKNRAKRLKQNLFDSMKEIGKTKFKTELFSFSIVKNGGVQPIRILCDINELPAECKKVTIEADNKAIREMLEKDKNALAEKVELLERSESLRIK